MLQFIRGSNAAFVELEQRAQRACVTFSDQQMPFGTTPEFARIGFEIDQNTGEALLLIDKGLQYRGPSSEVREWMASGTKHFRSFVQLRQWMHTELASVFNPVTPPAGPPIPTVPAVTLPIPYVPSVPAHLTQDTAHLTRMDEVLRNMPDQGQALHIASDALFQELKHHVIGQDAALLHLAQRISRHLARHTPSHPATVLALGPTGVGKTHTAEVLAPALRALSPGGTSYNYLRLDMPEYQERYRVSQLFGAPPGYIGHDEGSQLLDTLITNPRTVVLFDEIEKAHPDVFQSLMNAMDVGRLTSPRPRTIGSGQGREVDCRSAIFMFTSNLDASAILGDIERQNAQSHPTKIEEICRSHLRTQGIAPELIGRMNTFLVFQPLARQARAEIFLLSIVHVAREYGVSVAFIEPEVVTKLLENAQGEDFGARPDRNLVDDLLGTAFQEAARTYPNMAVKVSASPFECTPYDNY
ncbi:MAG TPA: AAA family ATPase [Ktedonobacteraceae bacterium]|nr:AAA family ATPase [Ktedonobacteraceae bacterium]